MKFIVLHYLNRRLITRAEWDNEAGAINNANEIVSQSYQNGVHNVVVLNEENDDIFNEAYQVSDCGFAEVDKVKVVSA